MVKAKISGGRKLRPVGNCVLVRPDKPVTESAGGILIPDQAQERVREGLVLAVGLGIRDPRGVWVPTTVKEGQRVTYSPMKHVQVDHDGEPALIMREPEVYLIHVTPA